jgi:hypothetical protein
MKRVLLDATSLKISRPGFDVDTALPSQLLLYTGLNFGQILEMGTVYLEPFDFGSPYYNRSATVPIGPYSATPEVFAWALFEGQWKVIPVRDSSTGDLGMYAEWEMIISPGPSSIHFRVQFGDWTGSILNADHAFYICYRKPF